MARDAGWSVPELTNLLATAPDRYAARDWVAARDAFVEAAQRAPLSGDDQYALANAWWWLGELDEALPALQVAVRRLMDEGQPRTAAVAALDLGYTLALRGEEAQASGWMARAVRILEDEGDCPEQGYLVYLDLEEALERGALDVAQERADQVLALGRHHQDPTLQALGVLGAGRIALRAGELERGLTLLDEAMVAAVSDPLDPAWAGNIYCNLMLACWELADWARASEWTAVTARWCESMPGAGPFLGICRVHRAQVLQACGEWDLAESEAARVAGELAHFVHAMVGEAQCALGDVRRCRGDLAGAEAAYLEAHRLGRDPCPGLALVRVAQGRADEACSMLVRTLDGLTDPLARARLLPALVEAGLAAGDRDRARGAVDELASVARSWPTAGLRAQAATARGALLLEDGRAEEAARALRDAVDTWRSLRVPYEGARARLLLASALGAAGEAAAATVERAAAEQDLRALGASLPGAAVSPVRDDGLTPREAEVLGLVADGRSNKEIAAQLHLSVRTVERHLGTIYRKLGFEGRSARTAAVRHELARRGDARTT